MSRFKCVKMFVNTLDVNCVFLAWLACCFNVCLVLHAVLGKVCVLVPVCFTGCKVSFTGGNAFTWW